MAKAYEYVVEIRAGFNKLSNDMRQVSGNFKRLERDVTGIFKNIGAVAKSAAVIGGVYAINQLKNSIIDLAKRGEAAGSVAEGFQKLGGSVKAIDDASRATLGLVGKFELMKQANQAMLKGIPDVNQNFAMLAEYAGRVANTLDQDTGTALNNLINGLATVKEKQLAAIGITIDADAAFKNYAEANNIAAVAGKRWQDVLTDQEQKLAKQTAAIEAVRSAKDKLAPVTDSLANAEAAYQQALTDGLDTMGVAINNSEAFTDAYRQLEEAVKKIDWTALGNAIGQFSGALASLASSVLPVLAKEFENVARGFNMVFGENAQADIDRFAYQVQYFEKQLAFMKQDNSMQGIANRLLGRDKDVAAQLEEAKSNLAEFTKAYTGYLESEKKLGELRAQKAKEAAKELSNANDKAKEGIDRGGELAAKIKEAAKEAERFKNALASDELKSATKGIEDGIEKAIKSLDKASFDSYVTKLKDATRTAVIAGYGDGYKNAGAKDKARVEALADTEANRAAKEAGTKFEDALKEANDKAAEDAAERYEEAADKTKSAFIDAFEAAAGDGNWQNMLLDFIGSLAGALTAAFETGVTKNPSVIGGLSDLGAVIGNAIAQQFGATPSGGAAAGGSSASTGAAIGAVASAAGQAYFDSTGNKVTPPEGAIGQNQDGTFIMKDGSSQAGTQMTAQTDYAGYAAAAGTIAGSFTKKNKPNTNSAAGAQAGAVVGTVIGAYFGQPALGAALGSAAGEMIGTIFKTGLNHAESKVRVHFEQWLEKEFKSLGRVRFFNEQGKLAGYFDGDWKGKKLTQDFSPTFNADGTKSPPVWVDNMKKWGDTAFNTFVGLGEAMKELQGITDEVGAQLGYILGTNLSGKIDNARLLVQQLGLSFEDVSEALLKSALKGQFSWLAFNSYIRDTAEAFKPGLEAVGAIGDAFNNLIDSAGQGREAVKSFKDIAVEAMEAGVKSMEELRQFLLSKGYDPEYVNALINSAAQRGIDSLKEWAEASDATAGAVVGDMEAASTKLQEAWTKMRDSLKELAEGLKEIPKEVQSTVKIKIKTEYDENTREAMKKLGGAMPSGIPSEGERDLEQTATASTGRSSARTMASRFSGRSYTPATGSPFGGGTIKAPSISGKPYDVAAGGMNLVRRPSAPQSPAVNINIDAKGAAAGVENAVYEAAKQVESRVIASVFPLLKAGMTRGGRGADY